MSAGKRSASRASQSNAGDQGLFKEGRADGGEKEVRELSKKAGKGVLPVPAAEKQKESGTFSVLLSCKERGQMLQRNGGDPVRRIS